MTEQLNEANEPATLKYTDGDPDLLKALAQLNAMKEAGEDVPEQRIQHIQNLLQSDIHHRVRIQADYEKAFAISDQVTLMGTVVQVTDKDSGELRETALPFGLLKSSHDLIDDTNLLIQDHVNEVTGDIGFSKQITDFLAPVYQRLLLADAALLELRKYFTLNMNAMDPRSTAYLAEIVARAETVTNGAFNSFIAANDGYGKEKWNYELFPKLEGTNSRKVRIYSNGVEVFALAFNYIQVGEVPTPRGPMITGFLDDQIVQLTTTDCQIIPVHNVCCWRDATEEEAALDCWAKVDDIYNQTVNAYNTVMAQQVKNEQAAKGPKLILPEHAKEGESGLILPQ